MIAYTSGPWAVTSRQGDDWKSVVYIPGTPYEICQCFHAGRTLEETDECEANATLIAAAPDLYEALLKVLPHALQARYPEHPDIMLAAEAIAKAEGK